MMRRNQQSVEEALDKRVLDEIFQAESQKVVQKVQMMNEALG